MSDKKFEKKVSDAVLAIRDHWETYRRLAGDGYDRVGRGTIIVDVTEGVQADPHDQKLRYRSAREVREGLSEAWAILLRIDEYNPERQLVVTILDFDSMNARGLILGEREDGTPSELDFEQPDGGWPPSGSPVPPIVTGQPNADDTADCEELLDAINDRVTRSGEEALDPDQRAIWAVVELQSQVVNGGFHQFFYNCGRQWQATRDSLQRVGAHRAAALFDRACGRFPDGAPPGGDALWDCLDESDSSAWDEDDWEFYQLESELPGILWRFWRGRDRR